jgi:hypothetical protein
MLKTTLLLSFILVSEISAAQSNWLNLFDGSNLDQWRTYQCNCTTDGWVIVNNELVRKGPARDLITKEKFKNFILELEWNISKGGNSGIILRANETEQYSFMSGIEMQILDDLNHPDGVNTLTSAGSIYGLYPNLINATKSFGEWNKVRIIAFENSIKFFLNSQLINSISIGSKRWNKAVNNSKFQSLKNYGSSPQGHVVLQDHGNEVSFRKIKIRKL